MISSLSHSIDPSLENSMQDYRAQLNEITKNQADEASASPLSENETQNSTQVVSEKPSSEPQTPDVQEPINYEEIYKDVEERNQAARDDARQAAVHVTELNTKQAAFDTYMDASQNTQDSNEGNNDGMSDYFKSLVIKINFL